MVSEVRGFLGGEVAVAYGEPGAGPAEAGYASQGGTSLLISGWSPGGRVEEHHRRPRSFRRFRRNERGRAATAAKRSQLGTACA